MHKKMEDTPGEDVKVMELSHLLTNYTKERL